MRYRALADMDTCKQVVVNVDVSGGLCKVWQRAS